METYRWDKMEKEVFFTINEYLMLRLEDSKTCIYVKGERFIQCMRLLLDIQNEDIIRYDQINSIRDVRITKLIIEHRDKPDVIDELYCYIEASVTIIKEYIRQKYPEHYRELFNSNPNYCELTPQDLKKLHKFMKRHFNIEFEI